jgi:hypothetical protein
MLDYSSKLVGLVPYPCIVSDGNPSSRGNLTQPQFVCAVVREMVRVALYLEATLSENSWELEAKITVGEEDKAQAARS